MKIENLEVVKIGRISDKVIKQIFDIIPVSEDEQTVIIDNLIYEVSADYEENEIYIHKYTKAQYANKYGEGTLLDLLEE